MEKYNLTITKKHRMEKIKTETEKINQVLTYISTNNVTKLNDLYRSEISL